MPGKALVRGGSAEFGKWLRPSWTALFVVRAVLLCVGLDRLPLLPTVADEVFVNDPAVSLSLGHGFVGFSLTHSRMGLDHIFANYPPVFIVLQSLVFRLFGLSAVTLRASSVICDLLGCLIFLVILLELLDRALSTSWLRHSVVLHCYCNRLPLPMPARPGWSHLYCFLAEPLFTCHCGRAERRTWQLAMARVRDGGRACSGHTPGSAHHMYRALWLEQPAFQTTRAATLAGHKYLAACRPWCRVACGLRGELH